MPVLIVSEKTWPHEGFSRNRSMRPSSSVTTIPNSSGLSTDWPYWIFWTGLVLAVVAGVEYAVGVWRQRRR